jgi:hypothetical protein
VKQRRRKEAKASKERCMFSRVWENGLYWLPSKALNNKARENSSALHVTSLRADLEGFANKSFLNSHIRSYSTMCNVYGVA